MNNQLKAQSLNRKSYRKFTLSYFSVTCYKHVELLWPISALDRKQVRGYTTDHACENAVHMYMQMHSFVRKLYMSVCTRTCVRKFVLYISYTILENLCICMWLFST